MNIVLCCLIGALCGILLVGVIFIVKYLCDISISLRKLNGTHDYYMCMGYQRLKDYIDSEKPYFYHDINEE